MSCCQPNISFTIDSGSRVGCHLTGTDVLTTSWSLHSVLFSHAAMQFATEHQALAVSSSRFLMNNLEADQCIMDVSVPRGSFQC